MLGIVDPDAAALEAAWPKVAPVATPVEAPPAAIQVEAPVASVDQSIQDSVSETGTNSHDAAFETWLSAQPWNAPGSGETDLRAVVRQAMAKSRSANSRLAARNLPANGRESPGKVA